MAFMSAIGNAAVSDKDWQKQLQNNELNAQREQQARDQAIKLGKKFYSWRGVDGASGTGTIDDASSGNNSTQQSSLFGGSSANSLFGNSSSLFGSGGTFSSLIDQSKDLARFRLGLDQEQARFSRGLREEESQSDFGRTTQLRDIDFGNNYKLADQQIQGQFGLEDRRQNATTERLRSQLDSQQLMQQKGFDQQNLFRSQSAALAMRGLR